jgi:hypothetical protein
MRFKEPIQGRPGKTLIPYLISRVGSHEIIKNSLRYQFRGHQFDILLPHIKYIKLKEKQSLLLVGVDCPPSHLDGK